jgi:hypothetical protein
MRRHLSYANVTATLALFVALGGGAYAATKLPKNSVTTTQVKNGTLLTKDFKKGQLKAGPKGAAGVQGDQGVRGLTGFTGAAGTAGVNGAPGAKGDAGVDGSAKAHAFVTSQGGVGPGSKGIATSNITAPANNVVPHEFGEYCITGLAFTPRTAIVQPDILSNNGNQNPIAEVQTPNDGTGNCPGSDQVYVRIAYETITGAQGSEHIVRVGAPHGFYIEIN